MLGIYTVWDIEIYPISAAAGSPRFMENFAASFLNQELRKANDNGGTAKNSSFPAII